MEVLVRFVPTRTASLATLLLAFSAFPVLSSSQQVGTVLFVRRFTVLVSSATLPNA